MEMLECNSDKMRNLKPPTILGFKHGQNLARAIHFSLLFNFLYLIQSIALIDFPLFSQILSCQTYSLKYFYLHKERKLQHSFGFWACFRLESNPHLKGLIIFIHLTTPLLLDFITPLFFSPLWQLLSLYIYVIICVKLLRTGILS